MPGVRDRAAFSSKKCGSLIFAATRLHVAARGAQRHPGGERPRTASSPEEMDKRRDPRGRVRDPGLWSATPSALQTCYVGRSTERTNARGTCVPPTFRTSPPLCKDTESTMPRWTAELPGIW